MQQQMQCQVRCCCKYLRLAWTVSAVGGLTALPLVHAIVCNCKVLLHQPTAFAQTPMAAVSNVRATKPLNMRV
jgi:hypothetical protein